MAKDSQPELIWKYILYLAYCEISNIFTYIGNSVLTGLRNWVFRTNFTWYLVKTFFFYAETFCRRNLTHLKGFLFSRGASWLVNTTGLVTQHKSRWQILCTMWGVNAKVLIYFLIQKHLERFRFQPSNYICRGKCERVLTICFYFQWHW